MNYLHYYNLEDNLFTEVTNAFRDRGYLTPEEFFSIVIWKANRSKTSIKRKLAKRGKNLAAAGRLGPHWRLRKRCKRLTAMQIS